MLPSVVSSQLVVSIVNFFFISCVLFEVVK